MLTINYTKVVKGRFPNNEVDYLPVKDIEEVKLFERRQYGFKVVFESNEDLFNLMVMNKAVMDYDSNCRRYLIMEFFPYGQMDRKTDSHLFSLKYVADLINDCKFDEVVIKDPHSNVLPALVKNNLVVNDLAPNDGDISCMVKKIEGKEVINTSLNFDNYDLFFYPDNGAAKKYSEITSKSYRFGNKRRNLDTGEIVSYDVIANKEDIEGKNVLIVDDLVMGGRTFKEAAKALKEMGAVTIDLYVTHVMPQARAFWTSNGDGLINTLYTADTLDVLPAFVINPKP